MNQLETAVQTLLDQEKPILMASTFESRRRYCKQLLALAQKWALPSPAKSFSISSSKMTTVPQSDARCIS